MLDPEIDPYRVFIALARLVASIYLLILWCFALRRSRLSLFWLLVIANVFSVTLDLIGVIIACSEETLKADVFGFSRYAAFIHFLYVLKPLIFLLDLLAYTLLVRWIIRERMYVPSGPKV